MLARHLRTHLVVAPSTSVGKSIFSTGLVRASLALGERVAYLKPVGTGSGDGDDELHLQKFAPKATTKCLFHFDEPVSPHLAVERAGSNTLTVPTDHEFAQAVRNHFGQLARDTVGHRSSLYIESAGGVHSPTLSGTSQLDAFRPLRPPVLLIASHQLGGISTTISAYESLLLRGYDVDAVLVFREQYYANHEYFHKWFQLERGIPVAIVDPPPALDPSSQVDAENLERYYSELEQRPLQTVVETLQHKHEQRIGELDTAAQRTLDQVWWPFVQHGLVKDAKDVMVIDSAHGDTFSVLNSNPDSTTSLINPVFDGSASWWTQCLGHSHPELVLAAAHAAGRYGHVMFPTATNQPALSLMTTLLRTVGKGWADRVFFSDNGSTGMEVALKMALRSFADREQIEDKQQRRRLAVLGLKGSYHGDTIGAMDACEGGVYSERVEWYQGRGHWLESPSIRIERGQVVVRGSQGRELKTYSNLQDVYDVDARIEARDELAQLYRDQIEWELQDRLERDDSIQFGTLILEPVIMGAGGMIVVDPLYQRILIDVVRTNRTLFPSTNHGDNVDVNSTRTPTWQGLPVIFDEVFTGLYRLGKQSASSFLGSNTKPDIACYAKILTGGLVPMSVTLASDAIFQSFWGDNKVDALLHGHSYTAHAVGCGVANKTLEILERMDQHLPVWTESKREWSPSTNRTDERAVTSPPPKDEESIWSLWSHEFVHSISSHARIAGSLALGTVMILHLETESQGYTSTAAESFLRKLRQSRSDQFEGIHARPLGNVVYFMSSLNSKPDMLRSVEQSILNALNEDQ
ncbi:uncharacterized protein JCM15063_000474 [Sporobolomyces koalae]|uniref:uncharacterized protein n=1 Tax=Sporobolomyces koalae TaxID=500713 RepID=UPI0031793098